MIRTFEQIILVSLLFIVTSGCVIYRHSTLVLTNVQYQGSKGDLHYAANTEIDLFHRCEEDVCPMLPNEEIVTYATAANINK
jgi:hypothetical protein